ncbi:MAG: imidazole glycerol phosphate synthase subunit HisH [Anaerolineales bacterium]|nr:imidazole glycerol phosphate synthase subunit HisH [Anaerolineales bacterium]MCK5429117.1 imidazole glycerol phosphate synthase subunit HisH [Anaerolineales bacterium]
MIALIDYGIGNLRSVEKAFKSVGAQVNMTEDPAVIRSAGQIVLPGVGAFGDGMVGLRERGLVDVIKSTVAKGTPFLGICLGMQLLFESSDELGTHTGMGLLPGRVLRFPDLGQKIPQTGWNQVSFLRESPLTHGLRDGVYAYFNHSYYCEPDFETDLIASTEFSVSYASIVSRDWLYGVQFHPEKSQSVGLQILRNFVELCI